VTMSKVFKAYFYHGAYSVHCGEYLLKWVEMGAYSKLSLQYANQSMYTLWHSVQGKL